MRLSVIIPIYNEESTAAAVIERTCTMPLPFGVTLELIVVDDGSSDGTPEQIRAARSHRDFLFHDSRINGGKGAAVRIGLSYATGDIVAIQDADLELDPHQIPELIVPILEGRADIVYGSRFLTGTGPNWTLQSLANRTITAYTNFLFRSRLTDVYSCYKVFRSQPLRPVLQNLTARKFELEAELTVAFLCSKLRIVEVPVRYTARTADQGKKIRARDGAIGLLWLTRLFLRARLAGQPSHPQ